MYNILDLLGRILISAVFFLSGINKIQQYEDTVEWMESFDLPGLLLTPALILEIVFQSQKVLINVLLEHLLHFDLLYLEWKNFLKM